MVTVDNLSLAYSGQVLFDSVRFTIGRNERVGLVGRNGSGKTTLLKILTGQLAPDLGSVTTPREYAIGYLRQGAGFRAPTVLEEASRAGAEIWETEKVLFGLGFGPADMEKPPLQLSGGFRIRLLLAEVLLSAPDLLLLDEPTNYLDIVSIRWLESFLRSWNGELVLVTHDRGFLDRVCTHTMIIHRNKVRKVAGDTSKLYGQIAKEEEVYEKTRLNEEKKRMETEQFINRFRAKARLAGLVQSRLKLLEKQGSMEKLEKLEDLEFSFRYAPTPAKVLMEAWDLGFSYRQSRRLFENFSLAVRPGDRIGVIGPNGRGKTTLLRVLAGQLDPVEGTVSSHPGVNMGYFGQTAVDELDSALTVEQELHAAAPDLGRGEIMDVAGALLFSGDLAQKKLSVLSGGEKSRVLLGRILLRPVNLLLLDEPTNHLDMEACDSLMAAIDSFPGGVLMVTHNELFLHSLVSRLVVFDNSGCSLFEGSYARFLQQGGWDTAALEASGQGSGAAGPSKHQPAAQKPGQRREQRDPGERQRRARFVQQRAGVLKPLQNAVRKVEREIEHTESLLECNNQELIQASARGAGDEISRLSIQNHELQTRVSELYARLEKALEQYEQATRSFTDT
jgi:ATP-binding cassette subfamily F protein 3